jgi:hypothetical protein
MYDAKKETCQHEADRNLWIDAGPAVASAIEIADFFLQPGKIQHSIDTGEDVVIRDELP